MKTIICLLTVFLIGYAHAAAHSDENSTMAYEVVDRETLREFVEDSKMHLEYHVDEVWDFLDTEARIEGDWKHESIYLAVLTDRGDVVFHGAQPMLEGQNLFEDEDAQNIKIVQELIKQAKAGGGYVEYYSDNPVIEGDEETGSPKVDYATYLDLMHPDFELKLIIMSGFYK